LKDEWGTIHADNRRKLSKKSKDQCQQDDKYVPQNFQGNKSSSITQAKCEGKVEAMIDRNHLLKGLSSPR
jgi:hypothetical protein